MKKMLRIAASVLCFGGALLAQNVAGTWQGTLKVNVPGVPARDLRMVVKIARADNESLKATLYSIDTAGGTPIAANSCTLKGSALKFAITGLGASYEGTLGSDSNSIAGSWTQAGMAMPLNLARATPETAWNIPDPPPAVAPMAADTSPSFEVATIKPSKPETQGKLVTIRGRQVISINNTVSDLIALSFGIHPKQVTGGPAWIESEHYDITGEPDAKGQPSLEQVRVMFQKLLAERFQLKFHRDKKELSVYALTMGKNGSKLTKSQADPNATPSLAFTRLGTLPARNASMAQFAMVMQLVLDKPVVDQTGIDGKWDFLLNWTPDATQFIGLGGGTAPQPDPDGPPDLFTAIQQQLGLKLDSTKAPAEVFVIDSIEKPSEN